MWINAVEEAKDISDHSLFSMFLLPNLKNNFLLPNLGIFWKPEREKVNLKASPQVTCLIGCLCHEHNSLWAWMRMQKKNNLKISENNFISSFLYRDLFVFTFIFFCLFSSILSLFEICAKLSQRLGLESEWRFNHRALFYGDLWKVFFFLMFSFPSWGCLKITCRWAAQFRAKFYLCSLLHDLLHF